MEVMHTSAIRLQAVPTAAVSDPSDFVSTAIFNEISREFQTEGAQYVKKLNGIFCFKIKKGDQEAIWILDAKNGTGSCKCDPKGKGDVTFTLNDEDLIGLMTGQINPQQAFFSGKVKLAGNIGLALKLRELQMDLGKAKL